MRMEQTSTRNLWQVQMTPISLKHGKAYCSFTPIAALMHTSSGTEPHRIPSAEEKSQRRGEKLSSADSSSPQTGAFPPINAQTLFSCQRSYFLLVLTEKAMRVCFLYSRCLTYSCQKVPLVCRPVVGVGWGRRGLVGKEVWESLHGVLLHPESNSLS